MTTEFTNEILVSQIRAVVSEVSDGIRAKLNEALKKTAPEFPPQKDNKNELKELLLEEQKVARSIDPDTGHPVAEWLDLTDAELNEGVSAKEERNVFCKLPDAELFTFAYMPENKYKKLRAMVIDDEDWGPSIDLLKNYIRFTYHRLYHEKKIFFSENEQLAVFNTGLVNKTYQSIFAYFVRNTNPRQPWKLETFCIAAAGQFGKALTSSFLKLPEPANYVLNPGDIIFDVNAGYPQVDWDHVIIENIDRLPVQFLKQYANGFDVKSCKQMKEDEILRYKKSFKNYLNDNSFEYGQIIGMLDNAIKSAVSRVRWNYKTAIPIYYPKRNKISLLLPLCLLSEDVVDIALVVERTPSGNYQGQTIFTLDMAYKNARLIARPQSDWLKSDHIALAPSGYNAMAIDSRFQSTTH